MSINFTSEASYLLIISYNYFRLRNLNKKYGSGIYYFNRNIEVDFYVPDEGLAVQASYRMSDEATLEREIKALVALNSLYPLNRALIVTYEDEGFVERDGLKIEIVPVWKWVLNGESRKRIE